LSDAPNTSGVPAEGPGDRVLIIGLDGGSWSVLDRYIELGHMPRLAELCAHGHRSDLISTNPPITPVAWSSFATGMNPGKHGVFGFLSPQAEPDSYLPPPVRRDSLRAPTLWRLVSDAGLRATVLSVPLTYPPEPVSGHLVSGMFTPDSATDSTYPRSLAGELAAAGMMPQFRLGARLGAATSEEAAASAEAMDEQAVAFFDALDDMTERLRRAALRLESEPWDLFVAVFMATDRLQHVLWDEVVGCDPDSPLGRRLGEVYAGVDAAVGDLVDAAGPDAVTIVMSDHGFGRCAGNFSMSRWLVDEGFASYQPRRAYGTARRLAGAAGLRRLARRAMGRSSLGKTVRRSSLPLKWSETRAYLQPGTYGGVRVNLRGRESEGIVEPGQEYDDLRAELRERLTAIRDPETGGPIVSAVRFAEEVHEGPEVRWAPDVIVEPNPELGYHIAPGDPAKSELVWRDPKTRGGHRPEGIFLLSGRGVVRSDETATARIEDIAPTALWLLGLPVPGDMDGGELAGLFDGAPVVREISRGSDGEGPRADASDNGESEEQSEEDREEILSRLKDLGYVD